MVKEYRTIFDMGTDEIVEKKSRFIGYVAHVESEEEADAFVLSIKKKNSSNYGQSYKIYVNMDKSDSFVG